MKKAVKLPWFDPNTEVMGIYHHANGRRYVRLININNRDDWTAILFAKYLLSYFLGRRLSRDEVIDHYDRNSKNDSIFNLRIVTEAQSHLEDSRRIKDIITNCIWCSKEIKIRNRASAWEKPGPFCKSCTGKYSRGRQLGTQEKLPPRQRIEAEFYYIEKAPNTTIPFDQIDRAKELDLILADAERRQAELVISELEDKKKKNL